MSFTAVRGQEGAIRILQRAVTEDHMAHAYLFAGPDGVGKALVAGLLAKAIQCGQVRRCSRGRGG